MGKLIECKTCKQPIAAEAKVCPHCGAKNKKRQGGCLLVFIVLVFFSFVVIFSDAPIHCYNNFIHNNFSI